MVGKRRSIWISKEVLGVVGYVCCHLWWICCCGLLLLALKLGECCHFLRWVVRGRCTSECDGNGALEGRFYSAH
jgi:hypothetical protein